jgi:integrase
MTLTKLIVEKAHAPATGQTFIRDDETTGLALRITAGGVKSFIFEGRVNGRVRRVTLGQWPAMTVAVARDAVLKIRRDMLDGRDPAAERIEARREATFGDLVDAYLADAESRGRKSLHMVKERINKYLAPWRNRRASDISRSDVALLHQTIGKERGQVIANRVAIQLVRAIFNYGAKLEKFKGTNPAASIERFAEQSRERFLSPAELQRVNHELTQEKHPYWRAYFSAVLTLGTRKRELLTAKWTDVDLEARTLRLSMTKNGSPHLLPIPEPTLRMLMELPSFARFTARDKNDQQVQWIFASPLGATGHLVFPSAAWDRIRKRAGCPDVTIHDLPRTLGSWMAGEGQSLLVIGRALGHKNGASTAIYARLALDPVRVAMENTARLMLDAPVA